MAEAVFTLSAEIVPQIDERELQKQAQQLSKQLNGILSSQTDKVGISGNTRSFEDFKKQVESSSKISDVLSRSLGKVKTGVADIAKTGKGTFLKFTDAINLTRRDMVGFGGSILDTLRNTNRFENAINDIKSAGSGLSDLPRGIEQLVAQVRSGTSVLDRAAAAGNQFAQFLQPVAATGAASQKELQGLNSAIQALIGSVQELNTATGKTGESLKTGFSVDPLEKAKLGLENILKTLPEGSAAAKKFGEEKDKAFSANTIDAVTQALVDSKNAAQKVTGPFGKILQVFGKIDEADRKAAIGLEQNTIKQLRDLGRGDLLTNVEKLNLGLRDIGEKAVNAGKAVQSVSGSFLKITGLDAPVGKLVDSFDTLSSGLVTKLRTGFIVAGASIGASTSVLGQSIVSNLDKALAPLAGTIGKSLGQLATFLQTNLNTPITQGLQTLKAEVTRLGGEVTAGLASGIAKGANTILPILVKFKDTVVGGIKRLFGISSPAKVMIPPGEEIAAGLAKGIDNGKGIVAKAAGGLLKALQLALDPRTALKALSALGDVALPVLSAGFKVAGAALTGFLAAAVATGVQFNSLQAIVRSTLPVILGSADATEKLLAQVNELNDTSPFARSAFLELTRVLAGFGVEAEKIVPLIDAIQQAVAATGGGEQDLLELGQAFARLQSQGRLSLDILQSFSSRGIDAIAILGQSFGKTQTEIRDMISGGLIPAGKAIDVLTKGLKDKFDGATDAVAKNLPGALDRVKAKTRDFGAALTKAFVSPTGGGAAIDLLNSFATVISQITKVLLPVVQPALQKIADTITELSDKAATLAKSFGSFETFKLKGAADDLKGLAAPLAALAAVALPQLLSILPVVGPLLEGLVGGIPAATIAFGVFALSLAPVREGLADLGKQLAPVIGALLPKLSKAFDSLGKAIGPILGVIIKALGPVFKAAGEALGELLTQLDPIFQAFGRLFDALSPVIQIVKNDLIVQFKELQVVFAVLGPVIAAIINFIADIAEKLKPTIEQVAAFTDQMVALIDIPKIVQAIGDAFSAILGPIVSVTEKVGGFISRIANSSVGKLIGKGIKTGVEAAVGGIKLPDIGPKITPAQKAINEAFVKINDAAKESTTNADKLSDSFTDAFNKAKKGAEDAATAVTQLKDQLKQQISTFQSQSDALITAGTALTNARKAQSDAALAAQSASKNVTTVLAQQARALRDVITPTDELAKAQRELKKTQDSLVENDREQVRLQQELKDLRGQDAADKRAALDRALERAKIALNKAQKDQNDLLNAGNKITDTSVNLAGLSLDDVRSRLNNVRLSLAAQKQSTAAEVNAGKTAQDVADERKTAELDVADAKQAVTDATNAQKQFELDTTSSIRDDEEKISALQADRADILLEQNAQQQHLLDLKNGETAQSAVIKDFEEKIKEARLASAKAQEGLTSAVKATALAELDLKSKQAEITGNFAAQAGYAQQIFNLKSQGLSFDKETLTVLGGQLANIKDINTQLDLAQKKAFEAQAAQVKAASAALGALALKNDSLSAAVAKGVFDPKNLVGIKELAKEINDALTNASVSGAIQDTKGQAVVLNQDQINDILIAVNDEEGRLFGLGQAVDFKAILKAILNKIGLHIPGFATGYAPGEAIHQGMNNGKGLVRMFEFGKEAVLPLTKALDMQRIVQNPQVLPAVLNALPRIALPTMQNVSSASLQSIKTGRVSSGPANANVYEKKNQREFAAMIGSEVKTAVMEALAESGSLGGNDVDINVHPSSNNEVVIAREVKRQVEKALDKW